MSHLLYKDLTSAASVFLLDLAKGKYAAEVAELDQILTSAEGVLPQLALVKELVDGLIELNKLTAPLAVQPDGHGGCVPTTNSHYNPVTGEFI